MSAGDVDRHIGARLRMRRKAQGLSLEQLGERLDLSHQQMQKYESGKSRMAASLLYETAGVLGVTIEWFFDGLLPTPDQGGLDDLAAIDEFLLTLHGLRLAEAFCKLPAGANRLKLVEFIEAIVAECGACPMPISARPPAFRR